MAIPTTVPRKTGQRTAGDSSRGEYGIVQAIKHRGVLPTQAHSAEVDVSIIY